MYIHRVHSSWVRSFPWWTLHCCHGSSDCLFWNTTEVAACPQECRKLAAWNQRASKRQSVQQTCGGAEGSSATYKDQLLEHYRRYADASANSTSAHDFKWTGCYPIETQQGYCKSLVAHLAVVKLGPRHRPSIDRCSWLGKVVGWTVMVRWSFDCHTGLLGLWVQCYIRLAWCGDNVIKLLQLGEG